MEPAWSTHCGDRWRAHVLAATGFDICDVVGPSPRSARDWAGMMRRLGVRTMAGVIGAVHGAPIPYRQAARGDVVQRGWAIGICRGDRAEFFGGVFVPMRDVDGVWPLGRALPAQCRIQGIECIALLDVEADLGLPTGSANGQLPSAKQASLLEFDEIDS